MKGALLRLAGTVVARVPAPALPRLGAWLSRCRPLVRRRTRIAARNLALAFPALDPVERARLLRATLASNTSGALETLVAWFAPTVRDRGTVSGIDALDGALAEGRGAVIVGAHYDSVELAIRLVATQARDLGLRVGTLARRYNDPAVERTVVAARRRYLAANLLKKDVSGFCAAVADGMAVVYVADQDASHANAFVPFFGVQASTLAAIPGVLRRAGGPVVLMWSRRDAGGRLAVDLSRPPPGFLEGDGAAVAARYMAWIEQRVREAPEQYLWVHRRFKTRPPGKPGLYGADPAS